MAPLNAVWTVRCCVHVTETATALYGIAARTRIMETDADERKRYAGNQVLLSYLTAQKISEQSSDEPL